MDKLFDCYLYQKFSEQKLNLKKSEHVWRSAFSKKQIFPEKNLQICNALFILQSCEKKNGGQIIFITLTNFRSFISVPESVFDDQLIMA